MNTALTGSQAFMVIGLIDSEISRLSILLLKTEEQWHRDIISSNINNMQETKKILVPVAKAWLQEGSKVVA
jgi:hypothetical protein